MKGSELLIPGATWENAGVGDLITLVLGQDWLLEVAQK